MNSEEFIDEYPLITVNHALSILAQHSFENAETFPISGVHGFTLARNEIGISLDDEGYEFVVSYNDKNEVKTQELFNWLGY